MTRLLALVRSLDEAELACAGGADLVEWDAPVDLSALRALVALAHGRAKTCLRLADPAQATALALDLDYVRTEGPTARAARPTIGVLATADGAAEAVDAAARAGLVGLMIDTTAGGRLLEGSGIAALAAFTTACRAAGLLAGLGGLLEAPDVARLLLVAPDILAFRGALRRGGRFEAAALSLIRDLVPRHAGAAPPPVRPAAATDRVFVRDFVVPASIGAYGRERGARQRVRFNVDVEVGRIDRTARDMRDVFSYDLVLDAIRLILGRGHVALVETLAEQVAAAVLQHPRVEKVDVRIEKLDMIEGTLGVAITRTRADAPAPR